jgi:hypothetical protein
VSNTRRAAVGAPLAQERYLSSPEFAEQRPVNGVALAARAALLTDPAQRSLLWWIQARSMEAGGLRKLAERLVTSFPDRVGTATMRANPLPCGGRWPQKVFETICLELGRFEVHSQVWDYEFPPTRHSSPPRRRSVAGRKRGRNCRTC